MTAYSFDQLISECEFTSGKILLSNVKNNKISNEKEQEENKEKKGIKYDIVYLQNFITDIEKKVKEIKEKTYHTRKKKVSNKKKEEYVYGKIHSYMIVKVGN